MAIDGPPYHRTVYNRASSCKLTVRLSFPTAVLYLTCLCPPRSGGWTEESVLLRKPNPVGHPSYPAVISKCSDRGSVRSDEFMDRIHVWSVYVGMHPKHYYTCTRDAGVRSGEGRLEKYWTEEKERERWRTSYSRGAGSDSRVVELQVGKRGQPVSAREEFFRPTFLHTAAATLDCQTSSN